MKEKNENTKTKQKNKKNNKKQQKKKIKDRLPFLLDLVLFDYAGFAEASPSLSTALTLTKMAAQIANYLSLLCSSLKCPAAQ